MHAQAPIRATLERPKNLARLRGILASEAFPSRSAAGRRVSEAFGFRNAVGRLRISSCMTALGALERADRVELPAGRRRGRRGRPSGLGHPVPPPTGVPDRVDLVEGLSLSPVEDDRHRRIWNELMCREHPLGAVFHAGCQLRYLVGSAHGWLGAVGFAAPALKLKARDDWIGWDDAARSRHLHLATGLSRFLIRPDVRCANLASKVLGMCLRRLGGDFEARYGHRPLVVETFVDSAEHSGISLAAANWTRVGLTAGRGRFAEAGASVPVKAVWMRPLVRNWRRRLGVEPPPDPEPLACGDGLDRACWAANELGNAPLGDGRLSKRLVKSAAIMADDPGAAFAGAARSDAAAVSGYYRMIEHPPESEVTPENILAPHRERTMRRMAGRKTVLLAQDGSDLNFATHPGCRGLGIISKSKGSSGTLGLHMHTTLAVGADGIPLGIPRIEYDAPDGKAEKGRPAEERKSARWLRGLRDASEMSSKLEGVRMVSVMDREADFFALFAERERLGNVDILVRAKSDRALGPNMPKLFGSLRSAPVRAHMEIHVAHASKRNSARGQAAGAKREARVAEVALRWESFELAPPAKTSEFNGAKPVRLSAVHALEETDPSDGSPKLEWILLTSLDVNSRRDALRMLDWYRLRWRIEDWRRILKSGCKAENLNHQAGERIERAVTIKAVIAWRLAAMVLMGRETPELPAETLFSDIEIKALSDFATDRKLPQPGDLGRAVLVMAMLGGYLNRKNDGPPGHKIIWRGYSYLATTAQAYERLLRIDRTSHLYQMLRSDKTCG